MPVIKSKQLRDSARGQECSVSISNVCNFNPETVVMAHIPSPIQGYKSSDLGGTVYCCSDCHDVIDRRIINNDFESERDWYLLRAVQITLDQLYRKGIVQVKGS